MTPQANADEGEFPAGEFCPSFAVLGDSNARGSARTFSDGRTMSHTVGTGILTNAETGQTFTQRSMYSATEWYDAAANLWHVTINGRFMVGFYAGDAGPGGTTMTETTTWSVAGHQTITVDAATGHFTSYTLDGQIIADVCAELAK